MKKINKLVSRKITITNPTTKEVIFHLFWSVFASLGLFFTLVMAFSLLFPYTAMDFANKFSYIVYESKIKTNEDMRYVLLSETAHCNFGDDLCSANNLYTWLYENIEYSTIGYVMDATETFENRHGDCIDMSLLFLAMAREKGLKCQIVFIPRHAYNKCLINEEWWIIDIAGAKFRKL